MIYIYLILRQGPRISIYLFKKLANKAENNYYSLTSHSKNGAEQAQTISVAEKKFDAREGIIFNNHCLLPQTTFCITYDSIVELIVELRATSSKLQERPIE